MAQLFGSSRPHFLGIRWRNKKNKESKKESLLLVEEYSLYSASTWRRTKKQSVVFDDSTSLRDFVDTMMLYERDAAKPLCPRAQLPQFAPVGDGSDEPPTMFVCSDLGDVARQMNVYHRGGFANATLGSGASQQIMQEDFSSISLSEFTVGTVLVYQHLRGNCCTHLFVVAGVERATVPGDAKFPHRVQFSRRRVTRCDLCHLAVATMAVYGCRLVPPPAQPGMLCDSCFDLLHSQLRDEGQEDGDCVSMALPKIM